MGEFNKKIKKPKTRKDWISRDEKVVNDYINDPYCMQVFKNQFFVDLAFGVMSVNETKNIFRIRIKNMNFCRSGNYNIRGFSIIVN